MLEGDFLLILPTYVASVHLTLERFIFIVVRFISEFFFFPSGKFQTKWVVTNEHSAHNFLNFSGKLYGCSFWEVLCCAGLWKHRVLSVPLTVWNGSRRAQFSSCSVKEVEIFISFPVRILIHMETLCHSLYASACFLLKLPEFPSLLPSLLPSFCQRISENCKSHQGQWRKEMQAWMPISEVLITVCSSTISRFLWLRIMYFTETELWERIKWHWGPCDAQSEKSSQMFFLWAWRVTDLLLWAVDLRRMILMDCFFAKNFCSGTHEMVCQHGTV